MRFGAFVPQGWRMDLQGIEVADQWDTMLGVATRLEALGYESAWVYDHFHTVPHPTQEATYEAWTLMAALAAATDTIRLGQMCTCNSYRLPSYMAKVASSVDVISGGRLEFALGAGWYEHEYRAYGYEFPKASVRIRQLAEAVEIIKKMWTEDEAHFEGEYYAVRGAINQPKSLQDPHPPLWIAGSGEQLTLRVVARHADYSNFGGTLDNFRHKSDVLASHCEAVGRPFDDITRSILVMAMVDADRPSLERAASQFDKTPEAWMESPLVVAGPAGQVAEHLASFRDAGCGYVIVNFPDAAWGGSAEAFAEGVMPEFA